MSVLNTSRVGLDFTFLIKISALVKPRLIAASFVWASIWIKPVLAVSKSSSLISRICAAWANRPVSIVAAAVLAVEERAALLLVAAALAAAARAALEAAAATVVR